MDIKEFSNKIADATKNMSEEEKNLLMKIFSKVSDEIINVENTTKKEYTYDESHGPGIPDGMTERLKNLKENFLKQIPTITTHRARAITEIAKENPGLPKAALRAKSFKRCCETAPLVIQDNELIVGSPCGSPRAGAFSPDIAWRWLRDEIDTIGNCSTTPFLFSTSIYPLSISSS